MQVDLLPDERLVLATISDQLGPINRWHDGTLCFRTSEPY